MPKDYDTIDTMQLTKDLMIAYLSHCPNASCESDGKVIAEMFKDIYQGLVKLQESEG